jgi:hypothetical protein
MQHYADIVTDLKGNVIQGASVRVLLLDRTLATIYAANGGDPTGNPLTSGAMGEFAFYAPNGDYLLELSAGGAVLGTVGPVKLYDAQEDPERVTYSSLAEDDAATKIGHGPDETVADALAARPTSTTLAGAGGAVLIGTSDNSTVQAKLTANVAAIAANTASIATNTANIVSNASDLAALQLADYTALRAYTGTRKSVYVTGYLASAAPSGIAGLFVRDDHDMTTTDNGGTVIVTSGGVRYKRAHPAGVVQAAWFGASTAAADNAAAVQSAVNYMGSIGGGVVEMDTGTLTCGSSIVMQAKTTLRGRGRKASTLQFTNAGDGVQSTWPINSSTGAYVGLRNLSVVNTNGANTGGGFVDVGGTFIDLYDVYFSGFKYGVIFDQTEVATVDVCDFLVAASGVGIWLVNGSEHSAGASSGYTNRITVTRSQFNGPTSSNYAILDDGGGNHVFTDNNINGCAFAAWFAGVGALVFSRNEVEAQTSIPVKLMDTKALNSVYVGPCQAIEVNSNNFAPGATGYAIELQAAIGGSIKSNGFANTSGILLSGNPHKGAGVEISGNQMAVLTNYGTGNVLNFSDSTALQKHVVNQTVTTVHAGAISSGTQTCTPASMVGIMPGKQLLCANRDGTNAELVAVTATTSSTFTATFAQSKAANFTVSGIAPLRESSGNWTPVVIATTTAGTHTYSEQKGFWTRSGNRVVTFANITVSAKDAAMAGSVQISGLPFVAANNGMNSTVAINLFSGFTLASGGVILSGIIAPNDNKVQLRKSASGTSIATVPATDIPGTTLTLYFMAEYYTNAP